MIVKHKVIYEGNEPVLCVYFSEDIEEFAKEFGSNDGNEKKQGLMDQVQNYLKERQINFGGKIVKVIAGSLVVATMMLNPFGGDTEAKAATTSNVTYTVESGDNLSVIASQYGITVNDLRSMNNLTSDVIHPGQVLNVASTASTYTVQSGDNLSVIASRYGTTVNNLKSLNNLTSDIIHPGQVLKISGQTIGATTGGTTYTVKSGDNLSVIASRYGTTVNQLKSLNNLTTDVIQPGQVLRVSGTTTQTTATTNLSTYTVQSGDSLSRIAAKTGVTVTQLKTYNNLTSDVIQPGQTLMLRQSAEVGTYTVKSGDSLFLIAQRYGMSVDDLKSINHVTDTIYPGQTLNVVQASKESTSTYTVQSGDSLWTIANRNGVTVNQIKSFNNLTSDTLQPGQVLTIPTATTTSPTPAPAPATSGETSTPQATNMTVRIRRDDGTVQSIALEEYLVGVVASEALPHFNDEAFKAQALAARTYAVSKTQQGVIMYDDARDQVYKSPTELKQEWGANYDKYIAKSQNAVNQTRGQVIKYNGELIVAYYHSTNNGRTENSVNVWGGEIPYLKSVSSSYDTRSPEYYRQTTMSYSEFRSRLGIPSTSNLYANVISRTDGDAVGTINISGRQFSGAQVKRSLGLRSQDFDLAFNGSTVTITTRGWGHNVGMSQYGAHYMGEDGYTYRQIISHYYTGVTIDTI